MRKVELLPAHVWTCPECGVDNFERCNTSDPTYEEKLELMDIGLTEDIIEEFQTLDLPTEVFCTNCGEEFEVLDYDDGEIDE